MLTPPIIRATSPAKNTDPLCDSDSEETYNKTNFIEARTRQGGTNTLSSVVWWDK